MFCRSLDLCYPQFPTEQDFMHGVLNSGDIQSHSQGGNFYLLGHFAQEWRWLQAGGLLLPDLVEFYWWLHTAHGEPAQLLCQLYYSYYNSTWRNWLAKMCIFLPNMHIKLAHLMTYEQATTLPIGRVVELVVQRYSKEEGEHLQALYNRVKGQWF